MTLLYEGADWSFDKIKAVYDACGEIALGEFGLDIYKNQIEVIASEQMLDAYSSHGLPLMYGHWSFGKRFAQDETMYRKGMRGLAYEIVINSNPCISYVMEENTMTMQTLVIAHAAYGHNHFFKNNYLFRQWTDADGILDYLAFAKDYIAKCEEKYGFDAVERVLDAAHALMDHGVNRYERKPLPKLSDEKEREIERARYLESVFNDLWRTVPQSGDVKVKDDEANAIRSKLKLPEENLLYFVEKHSPRLKPWEKEIVRIVRHISQYFYPQKQTKVMNEGCATMVHYHVMRRLWEKGMISDGNYMEFLQSHTNVVFQPMFDDPRYSGINPYALGFAMMEDIARIATEPTDEDREWFPTWAGNGDPWGTLRDAWENYRDESFILQYLSPKVMRDFQLFAISDESDDTVVRVKGIHDEQGYRTVRRALARQYDISRFDADIQVTDVDLMGDRKLILTHCVNNGVQLHEETAAETISHLRYLWGYDVELRRVDAKER